MDDRTLERIVDALENIAFELEAIRKQLNPNDIGSTASHLIDVIHRCGPPDVSGIESSLDRMVTPALQLIKESIDCIPAPAPLDRD